MEAVIFFAVFIGAFAALGAVMCAADRLWGWCGFWTFLFILCVSVATPSIIALNEENAARIVQERAACYDHDLLWVHDREVCVNDEGWIVRVR